MRYEFADFMKKYILILLATLLTVSLNAQCLGEDCSIKGRNKAARQKAVKMTGNKKLGRSYSAKSSSKRSKSGGFDPFASNGKRKKGAGGFDPFANNSKKNRKKGGGFDPFASNGKRKTVKGGHDSFANKRKKNVTSGGYAGWDGSRSKKSSGGGHDPFADNKRKGAKGGGYADWDGGGSKGGKTKGSGIWADGSSSSRSSHSKPKRSNPGNGNDWSQNNFMAMAPPSYDRQNDIPRSYSDFENHTVSADIAYKRPHQYKFELIAGAVWQHTDKAKNYLDTASLRPVLGATIALEYPTTGGKNWHHYFNLPTYGFALTYLNLGNDQLLGHAVALYPYVDIPLVRSKVVDFNFTNGVGIAYVSDYDRSTPNNPDLQNPLIGSPVNMFLKTGLSLNIRPITNINSEKREKSGRYTIRAGISLMHFSNGSFSSPNTGINVLAGELGVKFAPEPPEIVLRQQAESLPKYFTIDVMGSAGVREMHRLDTRKYLVGNFNTTFYWQAANIYRLGLGVDGFYDGGFADRHVYPAAEDGGRYINIDYDTNDILDRVRVGVCLSNEIVMGRVTTAIDGGIYARGKRIGVFIRISINIFSVESGTSFDAVCLDICTIRWIKINI